MHYNHHVNSGELNKKITIQKKTFIRNNYGEEKVTYVDIGDFWANVTVTSSPSDNTEQFANDQRLVLNMFVFTLRYTTRIVEDYRIKFANLYFDIKWIENVDQMNTKLKIHAERVD